MGYTLMGLMHVLVVRAMETGRRESGQGTVEYVGLILLMALVLGAVLKFGNTFNGKELATTIIDKLKGSIADVGGK